jgi:hypothetical protein
MFVYECDEYLRGLVRTSVDVRVEIAHDYDRFVTDLCDVVTDSAEYGASRLEIVVG